MKITLHTRILVVIPTILEHEYRLQLIKQLEQEPLVSLIVVVDNGGNFPYHSLKTEVVKPGCNMNWLHSNNLGAIMALEREMSHVCFLNDDVQLSSPFFNELIPVFRERPDAGLVTCAYNGVFCREAITRHTPEDWQSRKIETKVPWTDGTCMLIPRKTLKLVGLLDPSFRAPNWGADVDYSFRVRSAGLQPYVSRRAALWHHDSYGGRSAGEIYGDRDKWLTRGSQQAQEDLEAKYGPQWRQVLSIYPEAYEV